MTLQEKIKKMENKQIKTFKLEADKILIEMEKTITNDVFKLIKIFKTIELKIFNNKTPYVGKLKNKIFFTYSDHYIGNSGVWMSVGQLKHPHIDMDDRGYIKGVATDLDGYLKLRFAKMLGHNFSSIIRIYFPKFPNSKNKEKYVEICNDYIKLLVDELDKFTLKQQEILNEKLKEMTGCSLLHYLKNI